MAPLWKLPLPLTSTSSYNFCKYSGIHHLSQYLTYAQVQNCVLTMLILPQSLRLRMSSECDVAAVIMSNYIEGYGRVKVSAYWK